MKTQIPIYRAKKIDSDEDVEGYYSDTAEFLGKILRNKNGYINRNGDFWIIDPSTLAIHMDGMIDSEGTKIFASLSEDGKGGDICKHNISDNEALNGTASYCRARFSINDGFSPKWSRLKVTGIQQ